MVIDQVLLRRQGGNFLPIPGSRSEGRHPQGLTLTDFAIDGHPQLQALVFLMVDRFGCKINPQDVKERAFARRYDFTFDSAFSVPCLLKIYFVFI